MQQTAATMLEELGVSVTVADARFCKPLDTELVRQLADNHAALVTVEEGSIGGFASHVTQYLLSSGLLDGSLKLRCMHLPDVNIEHGSHDWQLEQAGLSPKDIAATVLQLLDRYGDRSACRHMSRQSRSRWFGRQVPVCEASGFAFGTTAEVPGLKCSSSDGLTSALTWPSHTPLPSVLVVSREKVHRLSEGVNGGVIPSSGGRTSADTAP
jgi:hypothetical protein